MSQLARNPSNFSSIPNPNDAFDTLICAPEPRKSFRSLLTVLLFKVFFYHGMFCVGMHRFNGSLHNSASVTHGFSDNTRFKHPSRILFEELSCTKPATRRAPKCSDSDFWHAAHEITETVQRLRSICCLQAFKKSEQPLPSSRRKVILKIMFCQLFILMAAWIIHVDVVEI